MIKKKKPTENKMLSKFGNPNIDPISTLETPNSASTRENADKLKSMYTQTKVAEDKAKQHLLFNKKVFSVIELGPRFIAF